MRARWRCVYAARAVAVSPMPLTFSTSCSREEMHPIAVHLGMLPVLPSCAQEHLLPCLCANAKQIKTCTHVRLACRDDSISLPTSRGCSKKMALSKACAA